MTAENPPRTPDDGWKTKANSDSTTDSDTVGEDDIFVKRDEDGDLLPTTVQTDSFGAVRVTPMTYGEAEAKFGDAAETANIDAGAVADVLREHVEDPDLNALAQQRYGEDFTERVLRDETKPLVPEELLLAVMNASGMDSTVAVDDEGNAAIDFNESGN